MRKRIAALSLVVACGGGGGTAPGSGNTDVALEARRGHAMTYDEARHVTLLFGGWGAEAGAAAGDRGSTWTWNGTAWTRVATSGPSARHDASMVYDASRQRVVLYGGRSGAFPNEFVLFDTWEWNGAAWSKVADGGPPPRVHQSLAYDRARGRTVLYGGFDIPSQQELHDIWEWNGSAWTKATASGSATSVAIGAAYDEKARALYLLSLDNANRVTLDVWNGTALTRATIAAPSCALTGAPAVGLGAARGGVLWAGSCNATAAFTPLVLSGSAWNTVSGTLPANRGSFAIAYDRDRDRVVLFGGESLPSGNPVYADTWEFDGASWVRR